MITAGSLNGVNKLLHLDVSSVRREALLLPTYIVNQPISSKPNLGHVKMGGRYWSRLKGRWGEP
jgi:hypothetical protein